MGSRTAVWIAWSLWTMTLVLTTLTDLLSFYVPATPERSEPGPMVLLFSLLILAFPTVGAVIVTRRSENPIGLIFCGAGLVIALQSFTLTYADYALFARPGSLPGAQIMAWFSSWIAMPVLVLAGTLLFLLFPDGRLPSRRWRYVIWTAAVGSVMVAVGVALRAGPLDTHSSIDNPFGIGGVVGDVLWVVSIAGAMLLNVGWIASGASLIWRWRRAGGVERQQIKWFAYAAVLIGVGFFASLVFSGQLSSLAWTLFIVGFMGLPVATGIAILRYRLYDIDRLINRTLVYGAVTAVLVVVYLVSVVALRGLVFGFTGRSSQLVVVASTLAIAALFNPLRWRIQGFIDRRFYRRKYDAARTLETFGARLRNETDLDELNGELVSVVKETMQPAHASLWLREPEERR